MSWRRGSGLIASNAVSAGKMSSADRVMCRRAAKRGMINASGCFKFMDRASHYRHQADHARRLAEATWQPNLEDILRRLAQDFDETAEDIEVGATEVRHPELLPWLS
jgi:hypothetical protein